MYYIYLVEYTLPSDLYLGHVFGVLINFPTSVIEMKNVGLSRQRRRPKRQLGVRKEGTGFLSVDGCRHHAHIRSAIIRN